MSAQQKDQTCKDRVKSRYTSQMTAVRELWTLYRQDPEAHSEDYGNFNEYGLSTSPPARSTIIGMRRGYFRWQISWGGPSDEFRFYVDERLNLLRVEYWFMDWFDGARRTVRRGADFAILEEIWDDLLSCGMPQQWTGRDTE